MFFEERPDMSWWQPAEFEKKRAFLEARTRIIRDIRGFFEDSGFTEVQTPALQVCPTMDTHIHAFRTELKDVDLSYKRDFYLHTSPEFDMKKLLVAGMERIYQICPVYRNAEGSRLHSPEFILLEWYRAGGDYTAMMDDCVDLLHIIAEKLGISHYTHRGIACDPFGEWQRISVAEAFAHYAGIDLPACLDDLAAFSVEAQNAGIRVAETDHWDDVFHAVMAEKIEPYLGRDVPAILYDYPASMAALSRRKGSDPRFAERFELYVCGIELANAFSELTDATEQRARFKAEMATKKALYGESYPPDEDFFRALEYGLPESGGIALGVDRLVMLATGAEEITQVIWTETFC